MPHIQVENWGLVEALEKRFKVTCFVGHDIRSLALAEHYFGASQDADSRCGSRVRADRGGDRVISPNFYWSQWQRG